ncbi:MAG: mechanosensitive ion channel family protein [bacterium]
MNDRIPEAQEEIKYLGVQDLNASSVDLLFITYCKEEHILAAKRKMRRELKLIFDHYQIEIPYQHITIEHQRDKDTIVKPEVLEKYYKTFNHEEDIEIDYENLLFNKEVPEKETLINKEAITSLMTKKEKDEEIDIAKAVCHKRNGKYNYYLQKKKDQKAKKPKYGKR